MSSTYAQCPHETRPGTTVCLHCRHEELENARRRRRQFLSRAGLVVLGLGLLAAFAVAGTTALQSRLSGISMIPGKERKPSKAAERKAVKTEPVATEASKAEAIKVGDAKRTSSDSAAHQFTVAQASSGARDVPSLIPVIPEGRSELGDSVFALREGTNLSVHFDTPVSRTRRRDKFEAIVRATLPKVFGAAADSILSRIPAGMMATGDLVSQLTQQGVKLPPYEGWTLAVWPETRPGQDGPLVVAYRLTITR